MILRILGLGMLGLVSLSATAAECFVTIPEPDGTRSECTAGIRDAKNASVCVTDSVRLSRFFSDKDCRKEVAPKACWGIIPGAEAGSMECDGTTVGKIAETKTSIRCQFANREATTNFYYDSRCYDGELLSAKRKPTEAESARKPAGKAKK